ncbi:MAG TPA: ester cyclase [Chloroflexota bacterium]|nr:ester cyclase [Chloroflexota bacterium]
MSPTENKALARRLYEEFSAGNLTKLDQFLAPNVVNHNPAPGEKPGIEGARQILGMFRAAFPDMRFTVEDQLAEGDKVATRLTVRGTHKGEAWGTPPTGKQVTVTLIDILRITNGKVTERWGNQDDLGLMQQIGAIPAAAQAGRSSTTSR